MKTETTIQIKSEKGVKDSIPEKWQWVMQSIFFPISFTLINIAKLLIILCDFFMFNTHHFELIINPKEQKL